jgi:hypothetical protein
MSSASRDIISVIVVASDVPGSPEHDSPIPVDDFPKKFLGASAWLDCFEIVAQKLLLIGITPETGET